MLSIMQQVERLLKTKGAGFELAMLIQDHDEELNAQAAFVYCAVHGALAHSFSQTGDLTKALAHARLCAARAGEDDACFFGEARAKHIIRYLDLARSVGRSNERERAAKLLSESGAIKKCIYDCNPQLRAQLALRLLWVGVPTADALAESTLATFAQAGTKAYLCEAVEHLWLERSAAARDDASAALYLQTGQAIQAARSLKK